jgi:hypothetical protein
MDLFTLSRQVYWRTIPRFSSQDRIIGRFCFHGWRVRWGWWALVFCHSYSDCEDRNATHSQG